MQKTLGGSKCNLFQKSYLFKTTVILKEFLVERILLRILNNSVLFKNLTVENHNDRQNAFSLWEIVKKFSLLQWIRKTGRYNINIRILYRKQMAIELIS